MQMGKFEEDELRVECRLPGIVAKRSVDESIKQLLDGRLSDFDGGLEMGLVEFRTEVRTSKSRQIATKYALTIVHAELDPAFVISEGFVRVGSQAARVSHPNTPITPGSDNVDLEMFR